MSRVFAGRLSGLLVLTACWITAPSLEALDARKGPSQYSRRVWTQEDGLPQDTIRAIAQTNDGYLWVGTDEGLALFDGYEFVVFNKTNGDLPSNSVTALAAGSDGSLWIGTSDGLAHYRDGHFRTYTAKDGLPDNAITSLYEDHDKTLWIVAGVYLSRFQNGKLTSFPPGGNLPDISVRVVREDRRPELWIGGFNTVGRMTGGKFVPVIDSKTLDGNIVSCMVADRHENFWIGGNVGILRRSPDGKIRKFGVRDGLPDAFVRTILEDRDGNIWVGTNSGIARLDGERFTTPKDGDTADRAMVRQLFEDREGNLWIGSNTGLIRYRDDILTVYGKSEGLPSEEPNTVYQDRSGRLWVGFHDSGLMLFGHDSNRVFTTRDGLPNNEVFSIREASNGDLLIGARGGMVRMHGNQLTTFVPPDPLARFSVFDVLEDSTGRIWLATPGGLAEKIGDKVRIVFAGGPILVNAVVTLCESEGAIWAGTYGKGLWRVMGNDVRQFTTADGLSSNQIRSLYRDVDGTLWIGTFGGGLNAYRDGKFLHFTQKDGLLSDNVADVADDGESLWLSTTRGICRVSKRELRDFAAHKLPILSPVNYGLEDGLRSAQCSPSYPIGGGGFRTRDGRIWFTTTRGLAVFDPRAHAHAPLTPSVHLLDITADGQPLDLTRPIRLTPGSEHIQIRYTGVHLSAPERVRYSYRLQGLESEWVEAGKRRVINYNSLKHGSYTFTVRASVPGAQAAEQSYGFDVLPQFYETVWFRVACVALMVAIVWGALRFRLRQVRYRFSLVLEERARLAREIHDTLAQGFVGISSQLDAVAMCMPDEKAPARKYLDLARKMARHSLTEARRSVMDLRAPALDSQDLAAALESNTRMWTAGSGVEVDVDITGTPSELPQDMEQHLLRIAQEAVTNALKHAGASRVWIRLHREARKLCLRIKDNGRGFVQEGVFSTVGGHFGLLGMRERAERLGGELRLDSHPGEGTEVEVTVPLP